MAFTEEDYWRNLFNQAEIAMRNNYDLFAEIAERPSTKYPPKLSIKDGRWIAAYSNIENGVIVGAGDSPQEAMDDFDKEFNSKLIPISQNRELPPTSQRPPKIPVKIAIYPDFRITDEMIAEKATMEHLARNFPLENRKLIEIKSQESERVIGCQNFQCPWNSDYTCFHDFPIFAKGMMGFVCISKDD